MPAPRILACLALLTASCGPAAAQNAEAEFYKGKTVRVVVEAKAHAEPVGKDALLKLIGFYKIALSPFFGQQCRFYPTCSSYAKEAIETHGSWHGSWLAARRLVKCAPWHPGGVDEVPPRKQRGQAQ